MFLLHAERGELAHEFGLFQGCFEPLDLALLISLEDSRTDIRLSFSFRSSDREGFGNDGRPSWLGCLSKAF